MKRLRWQLVIVILALVAIGVLLLGQQQEEAPVEFGTTDPTPQPAQGGGYVEGLVGSISRLNPVLDFNNPVDRDIDSLLFSGLVSFDYNGAARADLAESWGVSADNKTYNVSIRQNAFWHDGQPVTAQDVAFTVDLLRSPALPIPEDIQALWNEVRIVVLDDHLLQFILPEPFAPFLDYLAFGLLPAHLLQNTPAADLVNSDFNLNPVGSGPYRFDAFQTGTQGEILGVKLAVFEDYYGPRPFLDSVEFKVFPNTTAAFDAYLRDEIMGIGQVDDTILPAVLQTQGLNLYTSRSPQLTLVLFNLKNPEKTFLAEPAVRKALLFALNRQRMIDTILSGQAILANGPILPGSWAFVDGVESYAFNLDEAIRLIREAGFEIPADGGPVRYREGEALALTLVYPSGDIYTQIARQIQEYWARLGVSVDIEEVAYPELLDRYLEPRAYEVALVTFNLSQFPDPDPYPFWHQAQAMTGQNYTQWDDRSASEFLEQARVTTDVAERIRLYRNFQVRFNREIPALPLYFPVYNYAVNEAVQGVQMGPLFDASQRLLGLPQWYLRSSLSGAPEP